jgi:hypothetical protein
MHGVEELGLLKMDFLGLRNLDVITDTVAMVARTGREFDIDQVRSTTSPCSTCWPGDTIGVFQLESRPMRALHAVAGAHLASRTSPPCSRSTGPGPMSGEHAQRLRRPQERAASRSSTSTPTPRKCSATPTA